MVAFWKASKPDPRSPIPVIPVRAMSKLVQLANLDRIREEKENMLSVATQHRTAKMQSQIDIFVSKACNDASWKTVMYLRDHSPQIRRAPLCNLHSVDGPSR